METLKITNPMFIGAMAPLIQDYFKRIALNKGVKGMSYESLYSYFTQVVQFGGSKAELWVTFNDDDPPKPVAFGLWRLPSLPMFGTVHWEHLFNSNGNKKSVIDLGQEFIKFGEKHNAPYYTFRAVNTKTGNYIKSISEKNGLVFEPTGMQSFVGRKGP